MMQSRYCGGDYYCPPPPVDTAAQAQAREQAWETWKKERMEAERLGREVTAKLLDAAAVKREAALDVIRAEQGVK